MEQNYDLIEGKNVALLTNNTGRNSKGELTAEIFSQSDKFKLVSILTPEHGFYASVPAGQKIDDDTLYSVPVHSLYGRNRRPTRKQLENCDIVVVDIQDIGVRSYTYFSTVYNTMDACAEYGKKMLILDRPNPMGGNIVDGNVLENKFKSFIGIVPVSYVHGCTIGELATMANKEGWLPKDEDGDPRECDLAVMRMDGWKRWMRWEDTGLQWVATSPNIPTPDAVRGAAVLGIFGELGTMYIGIGTERPFQYLARPDFDVKEIANNLAGIKIDGMQLLPIQFSPEEKIFKDKELKGFMLSFFYNKNFRPYSSGIKIMLGVRKSNSGAFPKKGVSRQKEKMFKKATGTDKLYDAFFGNASDADILRLASQGKEEYMKIRENYLMYD